MALMLPARSRAWLATALVAGCHVPSQPSPPAPPPAKPAEPAQLRNVVVPWSTPLYLAPSLTAKRIDLRNPDPPSESIKPGMKDPDTLVWPGSGYVMTVVDTLGEFFAVVPALADDDGCTRRMTGMEPWQVRFHVERAALLKVVTRPLTVEFADGTVARLAPGVPVGAEVGVDRVRGTPEYAIETDGVRMVVPIPPDAIAETYVGEPAFPPLTDGLAIREGARLGYDGGRTINRLADDDTYAWVRPVAGARVAGLQRIAVQRRCLSLRIDIDERRLTTTGPDTAKPWDRDYLGWGRPRWYFHYRVRAAADLLWPDGAPAGRVGARRDPELQHPWVDAGNVCFEIKASFTSSGKLTLCTAPADLELSLSSPPPDYHGRYYGKSAGYRRHTPPLPAHPQRTRYTALGELQVRGAYDPGLLARVIRVGLQHITGCLTYSAPVSADSSGSFTVEFTLDDRGWGRKAVVQRTDLTDDHPAACVTDMLVHLQFPFPEPTAPVTVTASFTVTVAP